MSEITASLTPAEALRLSEAAAAANEAVQIARNLLDIGEPRARVGEYLATAQEQTEKAADLAYRIGSRNTLPAVSGHSSGGASGPLSALAALAVLDTADSRELLDLVTRAVAVAERVDAQRGNVVAGDVPLQPGESRGTDFAEALSVLRLRLATEVHGPPGARE
jgi:hypothetical protein